MADSIQSASDAVRADAPPTGTVTFLFADIEGSTRRWESDPAAMQAALRTHDALMRSAIESHGGYVFKTVGDEFCAVFTRSRDAIDAALDAQRALRAADFAGVGDLCVRMALHTGEADEREGDYFGPALNRTARLMAIGHGGQILLSGVTNALVQGQLPQPVMLKDLGSHRLRDLAQPEQVFQLGAPDLPDAFPPLRSLEALPNNLPLQLTSLVGRDVDIAEVSALLEKYRLVTLTGSGGVGKTRVCLQVGANLLERFADGVWFVEFAPIGDPELVTSAIATTLSVRLPGQGDPLAELVESLKTQEMLLLFDNCEHLVGAAAAAASAILRGCPKVRILATSRQGLSISGEAAYRMPSLAIPENVDAYSFDAEAALSYGSIALFVERAKAADARFVLTDEIAPVVADICRRLDGMAFAIELAAARLTILKPQELRTRLDQRFRVLTGGSRDALPRQQTLRALIDWSHDLLDEREQKLFRQVGIFVGGFTVEGATAVAGDEADELDVLDLLASLADKSLIVAERSGDQTRYRLLESTRAYALEKILAAGERADLGARHFAYLRTLFERTAASFEESPRDATLIALAVELEDFRAALDWAESNDPRGGADLLTATTLFIRLDLHREGIERARRFAALLDGADARRLARLWINVSACETGRYAHNRALASARQAIVFARASGDRATLAEALMKLARAAGFEHDLDESTAALAEVEGFDLTPRQRLESLKSRASVAGFLGDLSLSSQVYEEMGALHRALGNERGEFTVAANLAEIEHARGETQRAIASARDALALAERFRESNAIALLNQNLAGYCLAVDEREAARTAGESVLRHYLKSEPANPHVPVTLEHLALAHALDGDFERAARLEGYVNRALLDVGYPREYTETVTQKRLDGLLRERLDAAELDALFAAGALLTPEEAIAQGLS